MRETNNGCVIDWFLTLVMPYLRMFLGEQQIDEIYISEVFLQSVLRNHIIEEEKQKMLEKHRHLFRNSEMIPSFTLDSVQSSINNFAPLKHNKDRQD